MCTAVHFASVYSIPSTGLPWPIGVALSLVPVAIGILLVRRRATGGLEGPDALRVVTGIVTFFLLLNLFLGLGGRYDMTLAALGMGFLLWRLQGNRPSLGIHVAGLSTARNARTCLAVAGFLGLVKSQQAERPPSPSGPAGALASSDDVPVDQDDDATGRDAGEATERARVPRGCSS